MKRLQKLYFPSLLILASSWLSCTLLVDIFIVPTVFRTISSFFEAGDLGIKVFSQFNKLELFFSSCLVAILAYHYLRSKKIIVPLVISALLWIISVAYLSWLTPKIISLTHLWRKAEEMGLTAVAGIPDIQQSHQFYHGLYVKLDLIKVLLLSSLLGFSLWKQDKLT